MKRHRAARPSVTHVTRPAVARIVEMLEGRRMFDANYFNLSTGSLSQNWDGPTDLLVTDNDWSLVPSIEGFNGVGLGGGDPSTKLGSEATPVTFVNVGETTPSTFATGGPAEFHLATPIVSTTPGSTITTGSRTVAIQGSGSNAPYLRAYVNSTGVGNIRVRYDLIDIDGGIPNNAASTQPFALQYRVGTTGNFTNVDAAFVANAADQASGAVGKTTSIDVILPVDANNAPQLQIRIMTADAAGSDQEVAVENIVISGTAIPDSPGTLQLAQAAYTVVEGVGTLNVVVNRTGGDLGAVTATYTLDDGSANSPDDFTGPGGLVTGTVSFADGQTSANIAITINQDQVFEGDEDFTITLEDPTGGATLGAITTATVTIDDDDTGGILNFEPTSYSVNEGQTSVTLTVTRTDGTTGDISVQYNAVNGTATAGSDFTGVTGGTLNIPAGQESGTIQILLVNDDVIELQEQFTVVLTGTTGATLGTNTEATITIIDNDGTQPTGLLINEVFIDPPSTNTPYQYVELRGTPNTTLGNVFLLVIEGDLLGTARNPGQVKGSVDLTGATIGSNGLLMVKAAGGFMAGELATGVFNTTFFEGTGFQTGSLSVLLVYRNPVGDAVPAFGTDLDLDNTVGAGGVGTLELLPSNFTILDGIGNNDGNSTDVVYGAALPTLALSPDNPVAADAIVRISGNNTPLSGAAFYYGLLAGTQGSQTLTFSEVASQRSTNFPVGGIVTPGAANLPAATDTAAPTVVSAIFDPRDGQKIVVTFSEDVSASLLASDFTLTNKTTGATVTLVMGAGAITNGGKTVTLTFSGTGAGNGTLLAKGRYEFKVLAGQVLDPSSNALAADSVTSFGFINGDFNYNGTVDFADLVALAQNYNTTSGGTFARGDANYDGKIDFADLVILAQNYNQSAPAALVAFNAAPIAPTKPAASGRKSEVIEASPTPPATIAPAGTRGGTFATGTAIR